MSYEIIKTFHSRDGLIGYFVYKHIVSLEGKSVISYGISASDLYSILSVDDVFTDFDKIIAMGEIVANRDITVDGLRNFVIDYLSEM